MSRRNGTKGKKEERSDEGVRTEEIAELEDERREEWRV